MKSRVNLRSLDSLRGLLAVYVLAGHARWLLWEGWEVWRRHHHAAPAMALATTSGLLRYGHEAVIVFFVLSGFFIHFRAAEGLAAGRTIPTFDATEFFFRRVRRLVPPYVFALGLTVALDLVGQHFYAPLYLGRTGDALLDTNFGRGGYTAVAVIPALCLLPGGAGRTFGSNGPLWSLAYEIVYYLLYPAWLWCRRRAGAAAYGLGGTLGVLGILTLGLRESFAGSALAHYPIWLAGAGLVELCARRSRPGWSRPAAGFAVIGFAVVQWRNLPMESIISCYVVGGMGVVALFARLPERFSDGKIGRLTETLGLRSYTIYICHFPLLTLMSAANLPRIGTAPGWRRAGSRRRAGDCRIMCGRVFPVRTSFSEPSPPAAH